jgi:hypothetical protein
LEKQREVKMTVKRTIEIGMTIAIISLSLTLVNPVKAYVYYSEDGGTASTTTEWGFPIALVGEYTSNVLKLGVKGVDFASATSRGSMYVYGVATSSGWVNGTLKWYMKGTLLAPFLNFLGIINDAWVTVKFEAIDLTASASVEKILLHEHANPISGTPFDGEYSGTMNVPLYDGHLYKFVFDVEAHAEVLGVIAATVADFGGVFLSDSRIEWRYIDVPGTDPAPTLSISASSGGTTDPTSGIHAYNYGESVIVTASEYSGYDFNHWILDGATKYSNPITVTMNSNRTLKAYFQSSGGGNCPTLFVWNGTHYAQEGILDIHAESDVTIQHELQHTLALENGVYKLQLREVDNYTSHIDQVKLYAVDDEGEWHLCPLTYAYHNELGKVKHTLRFDDSNRVDLKPTEVIDLNFAPPISYGKTACFVFEINGYNGKPYHK